MAVQHANNLLVVNASLTEELGEPFKIFSKYVKVFDLYFVATGTSPDEKVLHGASVLYQYIDNDDDGIPDNQDVYVALVRQKATMIMFRDEKEHKSCKTFYRQNEKCKNIQVQDLQSMETRPDSKFPHRFDASLEECFHLVTQGYVEAYPEIFGLKKGSQIADAMDLARGGYFKKVPKKYPDNAWFCYYDKSCCYKCMIVEYIYWALSSMLHAQLHRFDCVGHEWKLCTLDSVENQDPAVFALLSNPDFKFPTKSPVKINCITAYDIESESCESSESGSSDSSGSSTE